MNSEQSRQFPPSSSPTTATINYQQQPQTPYQHQQQNVIQPKGKEPFVFAKDPNSIKVEGSSTIEKVAKVGRLMYQWQTENMYELQPEDNVARMKLANQNSNTIMKAFVVSGLVSWVATVGHKKDVFYYPLRAYIIKQICRVRPYRSLNPFTSLAIQAGIFAYALGYIGNERIAAYTYTFSQVCTPYGYMMRKLMSQIDDPKHKYKPAILTAQQEYDAEFERKMNELLHKKPSDINHHEEEMHESSTTRSVIPPRYQRKTRINRGFSHEEKVKSSPHDLDNHYSDEPAQEQKHYEDEH
ncbi:hypothetical protein FDP41_004405 [Naegleria fowleri]|uniref:Uncharacterized protein n=1 Tax=Naegleria fowleri TaxID=5763 RepID=A0A6A5BNH0_NAEFO|nr:uncharacterized protein FDP41_004405 [Naegleria fowleri]KAF0976506.1 hypothetical protein FDP41_004405 [Naegleria fowleri]CAG4708047.1 unnamed protein product [Naegleria fowleri]